MDNVNQYLSENNLHFKPLCARLGRAVAWASTTLQRNVPNAQWQGREVTFLSKAVLRTGSLVIIPLALIESTCLFVIFGLGMALNVLLCRSSSEVLQKYSLKAFSYSWHSLGMAFTFLILGIKAPRLPSFTLNALVDHSFHLGSAGLVQAVVGGLVDARVGRDPSLIVLRSLNLFRDSHPSLLYDLVDQVQRDVNINLREGMRQIPTLEEYLNRHPEDRDFVGTFNIRRLFGEEPYRLRTAEFVHRYLAEMRLVNPEFLRGEELRFELNVRNAEEAAYQDHLARLLKDSFVEIHRDNQLSGYLDNDGNSGRDLLEMVDASVWAPLAAYTQYKELLNLIVCPPVLSSNSRDFNRRIELLVVSAQVRALTQSQENNLIEKILRGSDYHVDGPVQAAYLAINQLSSALIQGPLMTQSAIDLRALEEGGNIMSTRNLFQSAMQEALAEVNAAQPA